MTATTGWAIRISVIGLGKLGAPLAAILASKGLEVIGVDSNPKVVAELQAGRTPVMEPGLQTLLASASKPVRATQDVRKAISATDVSFVVVPTPSRPDGAFSNAHVLAAVRDIGSALRGKVDYHLVVISSTVMPGSMGGVIRETLETSSGRQLGVHLGLCYNPEFIALGSVIRDMISPDFILIGESDSRAGDLLESIYHVICENHPPIQRMGFVNAELAKISVNAFVTTKISFANMISEICDRLQGADAAVVTAALGHDSRIGGRYLSPALGFGGPCFPRDNVAFAALTRRLKAQAEIPDATDQINRRQPGRIVQLVQNLVPAGTVGILGISYKPDTGVIDESQSVAIAAELVEAGYQVLIFDPVALGAATAVLGNRVQAATSAQECAEHSDLLIIATPWPEFKALPLAALRRSGKLLPVIDCWRLLSATEVSQIVELVYPGRHQLSRRTSCSATAAHG